MKIVTLTLNPAFDVHCHTAHFEPFHENLAEITCRDAGGKGINISRALSVNGVDNLAFAVLGEENAADFERALAADSVKYLPMYVPGRIRENITLHADDSGETRISFTGFSANDTLIERVGDGILPCLDTDCIVTFTGRVTSGLSLDAVKSMLRQIKDKGAKLVIDSRSFSVDDLTELSPWLIKPNQEEISEYLSRKVEDFQEIVSAAQELHRLGIDNVMVSFGSKGALLVCSDGSFIAVPPKIEAISTIGAGDSSIAGFLSAAKDGKSAPEMLRTAVSYGTAACLTEGTRPPRSEDISHIFDKVSVMKI